MKATHRKLVPKKVIPYAFVLDEIESLHPVTRPMFGCTSVYVGDKIVFILRDKNEPKKDNGVWLATTKDHHESLKKEFPNMRSITVFGPGVSSWQILPADADDFEEAVMKACSFVLKRDARIGKVPDAKKTKSKKKKKRN